MNTQRSRPLDTLQHIISSFKQFEKKLDKLQEDVKYHGHTLSELRVMVANLSSGNLLNPEEKHNEPKRLNKTMQFGDSKIVDGHLKKKRRSVQPLNSKMAAKTLDNQRYGLRPMKNAASYRVSKTTDNPKVGLVYKRSLRCRKSDSPRKPSTFQDKQKKRAKHSQQIFPG